MTTRQEIDEYLSNPPFPAPFMWWLRRLLEDEVAAAAGASAGTGGRLLLVRFDGSGSELTTGVHCEASLDFGCSITGWVLLADQAGDLQLDIWKTTYAGYPPTIANTITAAAPPLISSDVKNTDLTLTGWTTLVTAGDTFKFNIDSVTTITRAVLALSLTEV